MRGIFNMTGLRVSAQFVWVVLASMVAFALSIFLIVVFQEQLTPVPLVIHKLDGGIAGVVCPGEQVLTVYEGTLTDPLIVEIFYGIMDEERRYAVIQAAGETMQSALDGHAVAAYDQATALRQPIPWTVPDLPPGHYNFHVTLWMRGIGAAPVFHYVPFEVGPCLR